MIALSWCSSLEKKLRLFVQNRVLTILWMVQWTLALSVGDPLPLYHVDGEMNIADLLTKEHSITVKDVSEGSLWQIGPAWLTLPVSAMPLKKYDQIIMKKEEEKEALKECYSDPFMTSGEVDTLPSSSGLYAIKTMVDQLAPPGYSGPPCEPGPPRLGEIQEPYHGIASLCGPMGPPVSPGV